MLVLSAVSQPLNDRLQRAESHRFTFCHAMTWAGVVDVIRREPLELAVLDPALDGLPRAQEVERLRVLFPSLPLVIYTTLTPTLVPVLLQLGRAGVRTVLLAGHDDHPARLREVLVEEGAQSLPNRLLEELGDVLEEFPGELKWAIETVVRNPAGYHTVQDLAERARMDRRTCLRWFAKAALPPPSVVLMVLRVAYAHRLLQDPGYTVEDVAAKLGYPKPRPFASHVKEVFGMTPAEMRVSLSAEAALRIARERFLNGEQSDSVEEGLEKIS
jgi:AraC-like DNA-binding protein